MLHLRPPCWLRLHSLDFPSWLAESQLGSEKLKGLGTEQHEGIYSPTTTACPCQEPQGG